MLTAANVVVQFRKLRDWSTHTLAAKSGVPETTIRRIEDGSSPKLSSLRLLLSALDVDETTRLALLTPAPIAPQTES